MGPAQLLVFEPGTPPLPPAREAGAGLGYTASGVTKEARARWLAAHESSGYEEWGASGSARIDPGVSGWGLSPTLAPAVGNASSRTGTLWSAEDARGIVPAGAAFEAARRLQAEAGYRGGLFGGRFTDTPNAGLALSDGGARDYRIGRELTHAARGNSGSRSQSTRHGARARVTTRRPSTPSSSSSGPGSEMGCREGPRRWMGSEPRIERRARMGGSRRCRRVVADPHPFARAPRTCRMSRR